MEDRTVSLHAQKRLRYRKTSGAGYGENQDADSDVFGYRGVYYESNLYVRVNPELPCTIMFDEDEWKVRKRWSI
jgi:hypothetical protein